MKDNDITTAEKKAEPILQMQADMLTLIDIVTQSSKRVELIDRDALYEAFCKEAVKAPVPTAQELVDQTQAKFDKVLHNPENEHPMHFRSKKEMKADAGKVPTMAAQREAFSRRELIATLLSGRVTEALAVAEAQEKSENEVQGEEREITPEYFDKVLDEVLAGDYGIGRIESWDNKEFFHFRPLLSGSYARMLSTKNNPIEAVVDMVRETSRIYPALTPIDVFQAPPFDMKPEDLQQVLKQISEDPDKKDIRFTTNSVDAVFLYSNRYIEDDYADALADVALEAAMNP